MVWSIFGFSMYAYCTRPLIDASRTLIYESAHARLNPVSVLRRSKNGLNEKSYVCDLASILSGQCL
jgi:hypothetical protein